MYDIFVLINNFKILYNVCYIYIYIIFIMTAPSLKTHKLWCFYRKKNEIIQFF